MQLIGIDTGGTFTDAVVLDHGGRTTVGKALSTPGRVDDGVLAAVGTVADSLGLTLRDLLSATDVLAHGTTVGLNALLTRSGARVGLLTTAGFESTPAIAKATKLHHLPEEDLRAPSRWRKPDLPLRRGDVAGVPERVDLTGEIIIPLDEEAARAAIARLVAAGVESIAVCLLWAPVNPRHEHRIRELVHEIAPDLHVTLSSDVAARIGEYERTCTTVVDAYTAPLVASYLRRLETRLRDHGFVGDFVVMRMGGGVQPAPVARRQAVQTLRSGPAGGVSATRALGARLGHANLIATDVGGTSFDVGLVIDGEPYSARLPTIDRIPLAVPAVDIPSIGTGGGSIAWYDPALGTLRVGPQSAAARPGPACYGLGGTRPTLTDAVVVLGYVTRLGATLTLDRDAASRAIDEHVARPLGVGVIEAAEGIVQVACAQMRDLVRRTTIQRGHDPSDFVLVAYGGAGPQYVGRYAEDLGVSEVIIPALAPEFSAYGAISADLRVAEERDLRPVPLVEAGPPVGAALAELEPEVVAQLGGGHLTVRRSVGLRFYRQLQRIDLPVPAGPVDADVIEDLLARFHKAYELVVGPGSAPPDTPVEVVAVGVAAVRPIVVPEPSPRPRRGAQPVRTTPTWFSGQADDWPVYRWEALGGGQRITGPCLVESDQTTVVVYPGQALQALPGGDLRLILQESA
ncbi:hydantoinase/oxoprolinase family protein [Micromonospora sp. DR5-3]|uniref:hydantoinase/oxoprolinase family protein n=1 Tax=Micromonospora sp. DR5-3 TaxID=2992129 RepID=UPI00222E1E58|nr:hydantoinase/oxoprolinase family protein [Micromonospora sp. DR5-3]MCW3819069.1 hydantoinase/oxoprolinase family protein [Micromonospora sp. DR5-3]